MSNHRAATILKRAPLAAVCVVLLAISGRAAAQVVPQPPATPPAAAPADPLGRDTPRGTITGFNNAVHRNELTVAARYLQAGGRSPQQTEQVSRDLNELLDRYFTQAVTSMSGSPAGTLTDGLAPDREQISLKMGDQVADIVLVRVKDADAGLIWLLSSDSLARVPSLRRSAEATFVERLMPASFVQRSYLGASLAQWVLWALSILVPLALIAVLEQIVWLIAMRSLTDEASRPLLSASFRGARQLLAIGLTLLAHVLLMRFIGFSITFRYNYNRGALIVGVIVFSMLIWRVLSAVSMHLRAVALRHGRSDTRSLIQLAERVVKALLVVAALVLLLTLAGVDTSAALAGAGIAGVAVALGAQRSIENLIGGVSLLTDKVLAVGDFCRVSDRLGWIEDITLRSVRLRTLEQTLLSVPAGVLAQGTIENFATRRKMLTQTILRLRYGTTTDQIQAVLSGVRRLLAEHPQIEKETARVRLVNFGAEAIELELFVYITTADNETFLAIKESLLLKVAAIVESAGSQFAAPRDFLYTRVSDADTRLPEARVRPA